MSVGGRSGAAEHPSAVGQLVSWAVCGVTWRTGRQDPDDNNKPIWWTSVIWIFLRLSTEFGFIYSVQPHRQFSTTKPSFTIMSLLIWSCLSLFLWAQNLHSIPQKNSVMVDWFFWAAASCEATSSQSAKFVLINYYTFPTPLSTEFAFIFVRSGRSRHTTVSVKRSRGVTWRSGRVPCSDVRRQQHVTYFIRLLRCLLLQHGLMWLALLQSSCATSVSLLALPWASVSSIMCSVVAS